MNNALSYSKAEQIAPTTGASIIAAGGLPTNSANVKSEVLACLLSGEHMTGLEAGFNVNTARMAAFIYCLEIAYGWTVERKKKVVVCKDGRMALVSEYWIDPKVIFLAKAAGADAWCTAVRTTRSALRAKAADARRLANHTKAARQTRSFHEQQRLFGKKMDACHGPF